VTARLDPELAAILAAMSPAGGPPAHELPIEQARAGHEAETALLSGPGQAVARVRDLTVPGPAGAVPVRVYWPAGAGTGRTGLVAYFHGGGWALGSIGSFDTVCRALANAAGAIVASVGYRLAPEHRFPAAVEDCRAATRWLAATGAELGGDPRRLAVAGDSAGGNLATVVARRLRDEDGPRLRLQALVYPACDAGLATASYRVYGEGFGLTAAGMRRYWDLYLDGADEGDPDASPLRAGDLAGLPPAHVITADCDVLRDEGEAYAGRLRDAGVDAALSRYHGAIHGFWRWQARARLARRAVDEVGSALRAALA
jgi:acetyl esterase